MKIKIHNYGIIEDLEASLSPGLTVLVGPNGSGKSTFVDALYFGITGDTIDGRNVAERINWGAMDKKSVVTLELDDMLVERVIKGSSVSHRLVCGDLTLTKKSDINEFLFSRFNVESAGILKDVFFAAQLHATDLFDATDATRLAMLSKVFGFDRLEQCRTAIYKVLSETGVPSVNTETIAMAEKSVTDGEQQLIELSGQCKTLEESIASLDFNESEYERIRNLPLDTEKARYEQDLTSAKDLRERLLPQLKAVEQVAGRIRLAKEYLDYLDHRDQILEIGNQLQTLEASGPSEERLKQALNSALETKAKLQLEISQLDARATEQIDVCPLTNGTPCIELLRANDPELISQQLSEKREELQMVETDIEQLETCVADCVEHQKKHAALEAQAKILAELKFPEESYFGDLVGMSREDVETIINQATVGDETELRSELEQAEKTIAISQSWLDTIGVSCVDQSTKDWWQIRYASFQQLNEELGRVKVHSDVCSSTLENNRKLVAQLQEDAKYAEAFQHRASILRLAREVLSKGQLQRALLKSTIEQLNREVTTCCRLFDFKYPVYITDTGSIKFTGEYDSEADVKALSGGQKYAAAIIIRLAFSRVLRSNFPFVVLDEPSTCLDTRSRQLLAGLLGALHERNRKVGGYLVVPTHDELLMSATNQVIQIKEE